MELSVKIMSWQNQIKNLAVAVAVLSGLFMALNIGIGEAAQVVINPNDPANPLNASTLTVYGGNVDFVDRIATLGVFTTILGTAGLGILTSRNSGSLPFIDTLVKYMPMILGLIAFTAFSTEVFDIIQGDRVWSNFDDATNAYMLFLASSFVAGLVSLLKK